jgi:hypothetical protein
MIIRLRIKWWISCHSHCIPLWFFAQEKTFRKANESAKLCSFIQCHAAMFSEATLILGPYQQNQRSTADYAWKSTVAIYFLDGKKYKIV